MKTAGDRPPSINGYEFTETLYQGSKTEVYRAFRLADRQPVVLKLLRQEYPSFNELLQFRNQYALAKHLQSPGIVRPLSLETYRHSYALVMADFGGISLREYTKNRSWELVEFLDCAIQLSDILHYLYQNRVIHKDIKPANILIHPETKQVQIIDFSISSLLPKETQSIKNPSGLEGTLAYISPEQTGRMNRGIDYRSDFYSLGITFFELLTGQLPFISNDPMELIHCHMAKMPLPLSEVKSQKSKVKIPAVISKIVAKLMAKNAEDRYHSALGLKHDLEKCLHQLQKTGKIADFEICQRDICDRFLVPEKLYGRETEVGQLLAAFERVSQGPSELMLVAGFSGIGKTAVVNEIHKPIVRQRGYFIKGKFDQLNRNIPLSAFVQAFRHLMVKLLSQSNQQVQAWKQKILLAVGDSGQVLIEVIPELENIVGTQPAAQELSGSAAQKRFHLLMQKFVQVFTSKEHPLVIFIDDLQWADLASLKLLQLLIQDTEHLLFLGAYRNNEVFPNHPLMLTVDELVKNGTRVNKINLQPLNLLNLNRLVADTLNCEGALAKPLTKLVYQKTKGNPFFATQFLTALHDDKLISFDWDIRHWQCDIAQVKALALTSDVVEFMALQLQKLPVETQEILKLAACIGAQFDLNTLAIVSEQLPSASAAVLWQALQSGLIMPMTEVYKFFIPSEGAPIAQPDANATYKFLHDRVQQAAYSLIPEAQKQIVHLQIGRSLLQNMSATEREERIFEIVGQFNAGIELITQSDERQQLAELNLKAGRRAKASTAYSAAMAYLDRGLELLTADCWQTNPNLTRNLYQEAAEAAFSIADFERMDDRINTILQNTDTLLDRLRVYELKIQALQLQGHTLQAIALGREILQPLGITLPEAITPAAIYQKVDRTLAALGERKIADLVHLPVMTDPQALAALRLMASLIPSVFNAAPSLYPALACENVHLFLKHGNSPFAAPGYADFGTIVSSVLHKLEEGYQFGQLALKMLDVFPVKAVKSMTMFKVAAFTQFNRQHIRDSIALLQEAYTLGLETGDFMHMSGSALQRFLNLYFSGTEVLESIPPIIAAYHSTASASQICLNMGKFIGQTIHNLTQWTDDRDRLVGEFCDEEQLLPDLSDRNERFALHILFLCKLMLAYLFDDFPAALNHSVRGEAYLQGGAGMPTVLLFHYYNALTKLAVYPAAEPFDREAWVAQVQENLAKLKLYAQFAPMNFQHKYDLVEAECQRVLGNKIEAIESYDRAIALAKENGYIQDEALANELAAKFYLDWGKEKVAGAYMQEAYYGYARWGAKAKTDDLKQRYPQLLQQLSPPSASISQTVSSTTSATFNAVLDLGTVLKASQAISTEIELEVVLTQLIELLLQNAGAQTAYLLLSQGDQWRIEASGTLGNDSPTVLQSQPIEGYLPTSLVNYVAHTKESLAFNDAVRDVQSYRDPYFDDHQPRSVLCFPLLDRGRLVGIVYLENQLISGAFTQERLEMVRLLSTQAAISITNSQLYTQVRNSERQLRQFLDSIPVGVLIANSRRQFQYINRLGQEMLNGGRREAADFEKITTLYPTYLAGTEDIYPIEQIPLIKALQGHSISIDNMEIHLPDKIIPLEVKSNPIRDEQGQITHAIATFQDITQRQQAQQILENYNHTLERQVAQRTEELTKTLEELNTTQEQLIQSEKMAALGNLMAGIAHELRNPLNFVNNLSLLSADIIAELDEELSTLSEQLAFESSASIQELMTYLRRNTQEIHHNGERANNIISMMLMHARSETQQKQLTDLNALLKQAVELGYHSWRARFPQFNLAIASEYDVSLAPLVVVPQNISRALINLIENACYALWSKQTSLGCTFSPTLSIRTLDRADSVEINIRDNGTGIDPQTQSKMFNPFFTTKPPGEGTGLGLSLTYDIIVREHTGTIRVNAELGSHTEITINLPK